MDLRGGAVTGVAGLIAGSVGVDEVVGEVGVDGKVSEVVGDGGVFEVVEVLGVGEGDGGTEGGVKSMLEGK